MAYNPVESKVRIIINRISSWTDYFFLTFFGLVWLAVFVGILFSSPINWSNLATSVSIPIVIGIFYILSVSEKISDHRVRWILSAALVIFFLGMLAWVETLERIENILVGVALVTPFILFVEWAEKHREKLHPAIRLSADVIPILPLLFTLVLGLFMLGLAMLLLMSWKLELLQAAILPVILGAFITRMGIKSLLEQRDSYEGTEDEPRIRSIYRSALIFAIVVSFILVGGVAYLMIVG